MGDILANFQFLRPVWLLAIPIVVIASRWRIRQASGAGWSKYIAKDKLAHLAINPESLANTRLFWLSLLLILGCVALAGPSWRTLPGSVASNRQAMVILFDLSPSLLAQDVRPNRLELAKLKLIDLLRTRTDGETALIVYAGEAHRVSPLTNDPAVIEALVPTLHPEIMPLRGSQPEQALELALELFAGAELLQGDIVIITDGMHPVASEYIKNNLPRGFRLSILGVGTEAGAPIPDDESGFIRGADNRIIIASLDEPPLRALADHFAGQYNRIRTDSSDIDQIARLSSLPFSAKVSPDVKPFDDKHDAGYWLILLLIPFAVYSFRRNLIWLFIPVLFYPHDSYAWSWSDLWFNSDQQAAKALQNGQTDIAAQLFEHTQWKAVARFRNGDYAQASSLFAEGRSTGNLYNRANAEALAGNLERAVELYENTLQLDPDHSDAIYNRDFLLSILQKRKKDTSEEEDSNQSEQNQNGSNGEANEEATTDAAAAASQEASSGEQEQVGGSASNTGDSLSQDALQDSGQSSTAPGEPETSASVADDATAVRQRGAISTSELDGDTEADSNALEIEKSESAVLNPYAEQWLRTLPKDPGGFMRRKFHYQSQIRQQQSNAKPLPLQEDRL